MTDLENRFVEEYVRCSKGAKAAIRAGYEKNSAKQIAWQLKQRPEIIEAIKERRDALSMSAEEATKRISDNAATRLNDYITVEEVWDTPMVKKPLPVIIAELQLQIDIEEEVADRIGMTEEEGDEHFLEVQKLKHRLIRYEVELEMNPTAYRFVKGEPILVKKATVDLIKLAKADEKGAIKKLSFNERGLPSVELYPADAALETVLKLHGKLNQKIEHSGSIGTGQVDISNLTEEQKLAYLDLARQVK